MELPAFVSSVVDWLRKGYPDGLPEHDYVPLFALLRRRLSEDEVEAVTAELLRNGDVRSASAMNEAISEVTHQDALESDIDRVSDRLESVGWPGKLFDRPAERATEQQ
jgi:hypothetical protein